MKKKTQPKQKHLLFFDLEATGLDTQNDHIVQLAWLLTDDIGCVLESGRHYVKPEGFVIPEEAVKIHGITTEWAMKQGMRLEKVMTKFQNVWNNCWGVVGHNVLHDFKFVNKAVRDITGKGIGRKHFFDTSRISTKYYQLQDKNGLLKTPSLQELFVALFGEEYNYAHNAVFDNLATYRCFWQLVDDGVISPTIQYSLGCK